jgi:hypothetical protein
MYIPTIFFSSAGNCPIIEFSGSIIPDGIEVGRVQSGSDNYVYIEVSAGSAVSLSLDSGIVNGKLLLIGGGGSALGGDVTDIGGASSGDVIFQDIRLTPDNYFITASYGSSDADIDGGDTIFIKSNNNSDPTIYTAYGGKSANGSTGGNNTYYVGGTGNLNGGGGGAGSTGNGSNVTVVGNVTYGGAGGPGTSIPTWLQGIVGYSTVAEGGGGRGSTSPNCGNTSTSWGSGGGYATPSCNPGGGKNGRAYLLIPTSQCVTSSLSDSNFYAEGGSIGTFVSGGVQYKYHYFKTLSDTTLRVRRGITKEAKVLSIAGGAGSSTKITNTGAYGEYTNTAVQYGGGAGAGGLTVLQNCTLFGTNYISVGDGGGPYESGEGTSFVPLYLPNQLTNNVTGGGAGAYYLSPGGDDAQIGGSGGGGLEIIDETGASGISGQGYAGGNGRDTGRVGFERQESGGGGGGGAGGVGENAISTYPYTSTADRYAAGGTGWEITGFWSFLTGSVFTSHNFLAMGGSGSAGWYAEWNSGPTPNPPGADNNSQPWDGSGANPNDNGSGNAGIVVIVYPISGSTSSSLI